MPRRAGNKDEQSGEQRLQDILHKRRSENREIHAEYDNQIEHGMIEHHTNDGKAAHLVNQMNAGGKILFQNSAPPKNRNCTSGIMKTVLLPSYTKKCVLSKRNGA